MIKQKILRLLKDSDLGKYDMKFPAGTDFEIVADVVYMSGYPIPLEFQKFVYTWLTSNMDDKNMFFEDLRRFN